MRHKQCFTALAPGDKSANTEAMRNSLFSDFSAGSLWLVVSVALSVFGLASCGDGGDAVEGDETSADGDNGNNGADAALTQDWPLFRGDAEMQGISRLESVSPPLELAWQYEPLPLKELKEGQIRRIPPIKATAVVADGRAFVGSEESRFFCIDINDGSLIWEFKSESAITGSAAVVGDYVYFGDFAGFVYKLNAETGQEEEDWRFETFDKIEGGINALEVTNDDGVLEKRLYVGSHDYHLYCINAESGEEIWKIETDNYVISTPSIVASLPAVCFGGCDGLLHVVSAVTGKKLHEVEIGQYIANSVAARDGVGYVSHYGGEVLAIDISSGETVWKVVTGVEYQATPAVTEDLVLIGGRDKKLVAYNRLDGTVQWEFVGRRDFDSSPLICGAVTYIGGMDGRLYAIDTNSSEELWSYEIGARLSSSPVLSQGVLVICGEDGKVYGFRQE